MSRGSAGFSFTTLKPAWSPFDLLNNPQTRFMSANLIDLLLHTDSTVAVVPRFLIGGISSLVEI